MIAAVVPAAGRSERMGRPKLTLPLGGTTVIARVVSALREGGAGRVIVVAPPIEVGGAEALIAEAKAHGAEVVVPEGPTADMRASVELGLARLAESEAPDGVLLAPGDSPGITAELVARVVAHFARDTSRIVVPACAGRRGHPVVWPWGIAMQVAGLPSGAGVNAILQAHADR